MEEIFKESCTYLWRPVLIIPQSMVGFKIMLCFEINCCILNVFMYAIILYLYAKYN